MLHFHVTTPISKFTKVMI